MKHTLPRLTIPAIVVGALFLGVCLVSIRYIHRLQADLADVLAKNVASLQAAQELEIRVRQLRFHNFLYLLNPKDERLTRIDQDQKRFEEGLETARDAASTAEDREQIRLIDEGYREYKREQDKLREETHGKPLPEAYKAVESHPVQLVVNPCQELLRINKDRMKESADESQRVSREGYLALVLLALAGVVGGLMMGYAVTRGLRQSVYRLSVRVQDIAQHLDRDVGSVSVVADGDLDSLEKQMKFIVQKVEQVAEQLQRQQRELLRAEQLSLVGQLAAGVAHEIRNPLTGIKMLVEAAARPNTPRPLNGDDLQVIVREVRRLEQTVQGFLNFARLPRPKTAPCALQAIIRDACDLAQGRANEQRVNLTMHMPDEPVIVTVDADQIQTVLVNLIMNALDAVGRDGRIELRLDAPENGAVRLSISDSGPGIPAEIQNKLFQPFTTTKPNGTGLGLYLSARILDEHHGSIAARNLPEGGSRFTIALPMATKETAPRENVASN
ncbi:MAG: ATP-binding protein [Gemmataceae bacterium]